MKPVAAVNENPERRRVPDRPVVADHPVIVSIRIVRWKHKNAVCARSRGLTGEIRAERAVVSDAGDHWNTAAALLDHGADDVEVLGWRERVQLAGPARGDDRRRWLPKQHPHVRAEASGIQAKVRCEWCDRKGNRPGQLRTQ